MAGGEDKPLAEQWNGLNRLLAPHLLPEGQSPDTRDADLYLDQPGYLGPRRGRKRAFDAALPILGIVPFDVPWAKQRLIMTNDGAWTYVDVPSTGSIDAIPTSGWDRLTVNSPGLTAAQTGAGDTYSAELALTTAIDLSTYGRFFIENEDSTVALITQPNINDSAGTIGAYSTLQGYINGTWTDLARVWLSYLQLTYKQLLFSSSGTLTKLRVWSHISGSDPTSKWEWLWIPTIYMVRGVETSAQEVTP